MKEKLKNILRNNFVSSPKGKVVIGLLVITVLVITIFSMKKTLIVSIDGEEQSINTFKGTVQGALSDNNIVLEDKDKIEPGLSSKVTKGSKIEIKRAVPIKVAVDNKVLEINTAENNVNDLLVAEGIKLNSEDKVTPALEENISKGMEVYIVRVNSEVVKENEVIDYETEVENDDTLEKSVTKTIQEGVPGEKEITYKVVYEDGQEVSRETINEEVIKEPVKKVVKKGTLETLALSRGGNVTYKKKMSVVATAYSGHTITATGNVPKRNPGGLSTIAVDPRVIPLGTKVYVEGYGYAVAHDTGGAIKNNKIDLFMNSSNEAYSWGVRSVNLYIVAYPGQW